MHSNIPFKPVLSAKHAGKLTDIHYIKAIKLIKRTDFKQNLKHTLYSWHLNTLITFYWTPPGKTRNYHTGPQRKLLQTLGIGAIRLLGGKNDKDNMGRNEVMEKNWDGRDGTGKGWVGRWLHPYYTSLNFAKSSLESSGPHERHSLTAFSVLQYPPFSSSWRGLKGGGHTDWIFDLSGDQWTG